MTAPTVHRVDPELVGAYRGVSPSIIGHGHRVRFIDHGIKPLLPDTFLVGPAVTIRAPHMDIAGLRGLMEAARPGDVLVVGQWGEREHACLGEFRAHLSIRAGHAGFVIDGAVCDVVELRRMGYPIFTRTVSALVGKPLDVDGEVQRPIVCGGVVVNRGDLIVADDNGVCVHSETEARDLLPKVRAAWSGRRGCGRVSRRSIGGSRGGERAHGGFAGAEITAGSGRASGQTPGMHRDTEVLAFRCEAQHDSGMASITIRNVPAEVHDELAARAARSGQSLQEYLLATLTNLAGRPDVRTVLERARERVRITGSGLTKEQILDALDEGRRR